MIQRYFQVPTAEVQVPLFQGRNSGPGRGIHTSQVRLYRDGAMADIKELLKQVGVQLGYDGSKMIKIIQNLWMGFNQPKWVAYGTSGYKWDINWDVNGWHHIININQQYNILIYVDRMNIQNYQLFWCEQKGTGVLIHHAVLSHTIVSFSPVSSNVAGWKPPKPPNESQMGKHRTQWGCSVAMFDYQTVSGLTLDGIVFLLTR